MSHRCCGGDYIALWQDRSQKAEIGITKRGENRVAKGSFPFPFSQKHRHGNLKGVERATYLDVPANIKTDIFWKIQR